jgi:photosystem II stability/assembly factor-like uncharacterized protein
MKKYIIIIFFLSISALNAFSQDYWLRVPTPTTKWLTSSYFLDTVYGWACGDSGAIIHTSNSGLNWTLQNSGIQNYPVDDIFFVNRNTGWALVNDYLFFGTIILRTTNGGQNWTNSRYPDTTIVLNTVYFLDSLTGYMSGYSGRIIKTTNAGANWSECRVDTAFCSYLYLFPKRKFAFLNAQTGYACGGQIDIQGIIWRTTDSGANWYTYCVTPEPLEDIKIINSNKIISSGGDFEYGAMTATTYNGGDVWEYDPTGLFGVGNNLAFRTPSELWMPLTFAQKWALNLDSGSINSQWYEIPAPDSSSVYTAVFKSPTYGWAFGSYGTILKYNKDIIGITGNSNNVPLKHMLFQNYPNPFNPSTVISYYLAKPEFVKLTIYDLLGKEVKVIVEGMRPRGDNKFKFVNHDLATGIYLYKLEAGAFTETKKMVIVK